MIVDTSNEIGGDGDVPHPAVGRARRMQVPKPSLQHEVMIEAVENHNPPEVIVIDEIGRELEALAARTIAERGVQLIGTAHGNALDNLLVNPTLSDLVGGISSVTLSDDEARRRGTQKTVLERKAPPPTFTVLVEIQDRARVNVHTDVGASVDSILRGYPILPEERFRDEYGKVHILKQTRPNMPTVSQAMRRGNGMDKTLSNAIFRRLIKTSKLRSIQAKLSAIWSDMKIFGASGRTGISGRRSGSRKEDLCLWRCPQSLTAGYQEPGRFSLCGQRPGRSGYPADPAPLLPRSTSANC